MLAKVKDNKVYMIGSLRNPDLPGVARRLRAVGFDVYDDWYAPGPEADDHWQAYEQSRGHSYLEALDGWHAYHVFETDKRHLDESAGAVLVYPAGRSAHLEFGYMIGSGKWGLVLLDNPERWDVMLQFATGGGGGVFTNLDALVKKALGYLPGPF